jgi:hypothetical protein
VSWRALKITVFASAVSVGALANAASALQLRAGNIIVDADGGFAPKALPRHTDAPITIHGGGRISTVSGDLPPILETIELEFDRHGSLDTTGLPKCTRGALEATTTAEARARCPDAIVGTGSGTAVIAFPEQRPIRLTSPITLFNGPAKHGDATVIAHAFLSSPVSSTFIVPIVIEPVHKGAYGYRTNARIPKIANGYGVPISGSLRIGTKWTSGGVEHSYLSARCETGRLQARGQFSFDDDTVLSGTFLRPCKVRK